MKKIISLFLVLVMCIGMLPVSVFSDDDVGAENTDETVIEQQNEATEKVASTSVTEIEESSNIELGDDICTEFSDSDLNLSTDYSSPFVLEEAYAYYLTLDAERAELYLASLSEDNRFILLDYIDAMNEITTLEAEIATEVAQLDTEPVAEMEEERQEDVPEEPSSESDSFEKVTKDIESSENTEIDDNEDKSICTQNDFLDTCEIVDSNASEKEKSTEITSEETITFLDSASENILDEEHFPDTAFLAKLQMLYPNGLTEYEAKNVTTLSLYNSGISSMEGIEYFTGLTYLNCGYNQIATLDMSTCQALQELDCSYNVLTELNINACTSLQKLYCGSNQLTSIDVCKCTELVELNCSENKLISLNLKECPKLKQIAVVYNQLSEIDLSSCTALYSFVCHGNRLSFLNFSNCTELYNINCRENNITSLDLTNCISLEFLDCSNNQLSELDLSDSSILQDVNCSNNVLQNIEIAAYSTLRLFNCSGNKLTTLDMSVFPNLEELNCYYSQLKSLIVSGCTKLSYLDCQSNNLSTIDLSTCSGLSQSYCGGQTLSSTDTYKLGTQYIIDIEPIVGKDNLSNVTADNYNSATGLLTADEGSTVKYSYNTQYNDTTMEVTISEVNVMAECIASGDCGTNSNATWLLGTDGALRIIGSGTMDDYSYTVESGSYQTTAPWAEYTDSISSILIEPGISNIGSYAFYRLTGLSYVEFPNSIATIGKYAFYKCTSLTSVNLPASLTSIGNKALSEVTQITFAGTKNEWSVINYTTTASVKCSDGDANIIAEGTYGTGITWKLTTDGLLDLEGSGAINVSSPSAIPWNSYKDLIVSAKIGSDVTKLNFAFCECSNLKTVVISTGIKEISIDAFGRCSSLQEINIPSSVTTIDLDAFYGCSSLQNISIPNSVTSIGTEAFCDCTALKNIEIPESVISIGLRAFKGCINLSNLSISDGVTSIVAEAFSNCTSLISITIPDSVKSIGSYAFYGCSSLQNISISDSITSIDSYTFYGCTGLTNVLIPESITSIESNAFRNCTGLTSVTLSESVSSIGEQTFYDCTNLKTIKFLGSAPTICNYCFSGVKATAYYSGTDTTWTTNVMQDYGGTITWKPYGDTALRIDGLNAGSTIYADGVSYTVCANGVIDVPLSTTTLMTFTYSGMSSTDAHVQYPTGVKVYTISFDDDNQVGTYVPALDNVLAYSGASIKTVDNQGLRIIYSISDAVKSALIAGTLEGLSGYTLAEYGTVATWADTSTNPYLGCAGAMSAYAYRNNGSSTYDDTELDDEFNINDSNFYYCNAFTFTDFERTKPDLAIRPYMILNTPDGDTKTIYGGVVIRNIGYVAYQCRDLFTAGTLQYNYIHKIIDYVYPDGYTEWTAAQY